MRSPLEQYREEPNSPVYQRGALIPWIARLLLCTLMAGTFAAQASDESAKTIWRFSHFLPANHALAQGMADWAHQLEQASGGKIEIRIYPSSQLGSGLDHYDMVARRVAQLGWIVPGYEQGRFPIFSILETPFLISDATTGVQAFHAWYSDYAQLEMEEVIPCLMTSSPPGRLSFTDKRVSQPSDIAGLRIRVANAAVGRYVRSLGGVTINIALSEARQSLERGMIDGMPFGFYSIQSMNLGKLLQLHLDLPFSSSPAILGINREEYVALDSTTREVVDSFCTADWSSKVVARWVALEEQTREQYLQDNEREVYSASSSTKEQWMDATQPLVTEWRSLAERRGLNNSEQALNRLEELVIRYVGNPVPWNPEGAGGGDHNE